jgi:hypothetical protein
MNFKTTLIIIFTGVKLYKCFIYLRGKINKTHKIQKMKTCFADEDDEEYKKTIKLSNMINSYLTDNLIMENENTIQKNKPLYTLIWYDCINCKKLLNDMDKLNLKKIYVNEGLYYDVTDTNKKYIKPLLYKDSEFMGDTLFDIYTTIYSEC